MRQIRQFNAIITVIDIGLTSRARQYRTQVDGRRMAFSSQEGIRAMAWPIVLSGGEMGRQNIEKIRSEEKRGRAVRS
jgi:hypothetical protein